MPFKGKYDQCSRGLRPNLQTPRPPDFSKTRPKFTKNLSRIDRKVCCNSVGAIFVLALSQDDLKSAVSQPQPWFQHAANLLIFPKHTLPTFYRRNQSFTRSPSQAPRRKMTANGFSSYELFITIVDFSAPARCFVPLLVKTHSIELLGSFTETLCFC